MANAESASIFSGPEAHMTARNIARPEANDAEPSNGTSLQEAASATAAHRSACAVCPVNTEDPSGQDGQRRITLDPCVSERMHPLLARWTSDRRCRWAGPMW